MSPQPTMVMPMGILLLLLLVVTAAVAGAVVLIARGRAWRWVAAGVLAVLALPVLALFFVRFAGSSRAPVAVAPSPGPYPVRVMTTPAEGHGDLHRAYEDVVQSYTFAGSQHVAVEAEAHAEGHAEGHAEPVAVEAEDHGTTPELETRRMPPPASLAPAGPAQWLKSLNQQDVAQEPHTSTETLYKFVADRVTTSVDTVSEPGSPRRVVADKVTSELTNWLVHRINASADGTVPAQQPANETWVRLAWRGRAERKVTWWPTPLAKGTLEARIAGPKGTAVVTAKLDEKPWLYNPPERSPHAEYAVVVSEQPEASAAQALQSVRRQATLTLYPRVQAELMAMTEGGRVSDATLKQHVRAAAQSNRGVVDECVVRVDRPYGPVWYAAQLRELAPHVLQPVAAGAVGATQEHRQTFAGMIAGLGGMVLVLGVLYLALNALTRGYFRGRLRAATVVVALVAGAAVLVLMA
jgi:hypothetical protein